MENMKTQFFRRIPPQDPPVDVVAEPATPDRAAPVVTPPAVVTASAMGTPPEIWFPVPGTDAPRRWKRPSLKPILFALTLFIFLSTGAAIAASLGVLYYSNMIAPGIHVSGVDIGGQTRAEATAVLDTTWQRQTIVLEGGEQIWMVAPADLGLTLDVAATVARAHARSRSLETLLQLVRDGEAAVSPVWHMNTAVAEAYLQTLAPQLDVAPINAGLQVVNGQVETTLPVEGQTLDIEATIAGLHQNGANTIVNGHLPLVMSTVQPAVTDVSDAVAKANELLATTVSIHAYDPVGDEAVTWVAGPAIWGDWLSFTVNVNDPTQFEWVLDPARASAFFAARNAALGDQRHLDVAAALTAITDAITNQTESVNLRIYYGQRQHVVQPGETFSSIGRAYGIPYPWIQEANPGVADALSVGQTITIPSPDDLLPYPVIEGKRVVVSLSQQRAWVYENGNLKWEWLASTGIASSPTAPGVFQVQTHEPNAYAGNWDLWMPNFMGIYRPVPTSDFMNGFHGFPTRDGANLLWTNNLGTPVTYGCILLSNENATQLYEWAEQGVVVEIVP
jgi:lipoprotein-anchoring transpeptidase ErfK/SrfK